MCSTCAFVSTLCLFLCNYWLSLICNFFQSFCSWISTYYALRKAGFWWSSMWWKYVLLLRFLVYMCTCVHWLSWVFLQMILWCFFFPICKFQSFCSWNYTFCAFEEGRIWCRSLWYTCWVCRKVANFVCGWCALFWKCFCFKSLDVYKMIIPSGERESTLIAPNQWRNRLGVGGGVPPWHFWPGNFCWPTGKREARKKGKWRRKEGKLKKGR